MDIKTIAASLRVQSIDDRISMPRFLIVLQMIVAVMESNSATAEKKELLLINRVYVNHYLSRPFRFRFDSNKFHSMED